MDHMQWSRSRFWLCHFLYSRHEREPIDWGTDASLPAPVRKPLIRWLKTQQCLATEGGVWLIERAARDCSRDHAYVQSLRLLVREQRHHNELAQKLLRRMGAHSDGTRGLACRLRRGVAGVRRVLLGPRFELSLLLMRTLLDLTILDLVAQLPDGALHGAVRNVAKDKRAHTVFCAERLTALYADFNFVRRNLRRGRLRLMWGTILITAAWRHGGVIHKSGTSRRRFVIHAYRRFAGLLEQIVPYRRDALLAALGTQRREPYAKPRRL